MKQFEDMQRQSSEAQMRGFEAETRVHDSEALVSQTALKEFRQRFYLRQRLKNHFQRLYGEVSAHSKY